jgi:uncharacterized protein YkwD
MKRLCLALAVVVAAALSVTASGIGARSRAAALDHAVLGRINAFRARHGLRRLRLSHQLEAAASQHSREMVSDGYFAHDSADGTSWYTRISRYYPPGSYAHWCIGENIVWASPRLSPAGALRAWIASPEHLRNLLDPRWRQIGVSVVHASSAPGVYGHRPVTVVTADFGARR